MFFLVQTILKMNRCTVRSGSCYMLANMTLHFRQRGRVVRVPGLYSTQCRFKIYSTHSVMSWEKTLCGTLPCLVVFARSSKLKP